MFTLFSGVTSIGAFLHHLIPHYVWIDTIGKITAFTGAKQITAANIKALLEKALVETS